MKKELLNVFLLKKSIKNLDIFLQENEIFL